MQNLLSGKVSVKIKRGGKGMMKINLIEILHPIMDILFVALNPPETSNLNGHYFSRNLSFWNLLYNAGLITQPVKSKFTGDDEVFRENKINCNKAIFGITDLCHDLVETKSSKVKVEGFRVQRILAILQKHKIRNLCLIHSEVGKAFEIIPSLNRTQKYGLIGKINKTDVFEMPFHNASIIDKHLLYQKIKSHL